MLGDKIGSQQGKMVSRRILPGGDFRYIQMEVTIEEQGDLYGSQVMNMGTYTVYERNGGQLFGQGQGIIGTPDGAGAIWNGHGVGRMGENMSMTFAFSLALQAPTEGPLARLNGCLVVGEHTVDGDGNTKTTIWEWKA
jgi:hypothetical protein